MIEGTIKYIYLCLGDENDYTSKAEEYLLHLPNLDKIKQQYRVKSFLERVDNPMADEYAILKETLIDDAELEGLRDQYPRERRRQ